MAPLPPKTILFSNQDMELIRIDSRSLLLDDAENGAAAGQAFQIVNCDSEAMPQDYQVAISSRENLCDIGNTPEGMRRNSSSQTAFSTRGSESSQLTDVSFVNTDVSTSVGDLRSSNPYERIETSCSSPLVAGYGKRGGTLPTKVASSGSIKMRAPLPEFRRHTSSIEETDDYTRLDRGEKAPALVPSRQGSRVTSVSSMTASIPSNHPFPSLLNKHRSSITNSGRGSPRSDTESPPLPARNSLPFTPTGKTAPHVEDPPPSYDDVVSPLSSSSSPFSPSGASMITNGAYESVPPNAAALDVVADRTEGRSRNQLPKGERPWYNASNSSLDRQQQPPTSHHNGRSTGVRGAGVSISPYSQVSNFEIDSRETRGEGGGANTGVPRFSISSNGGALPYTDSCIEGLSK